MALWRERVHAAQRAIPVSNHVKTLFVLLATGVAGYHSLWFGVVLFVALALPIVAVVMHARDARNAVEAADKLLALTQRMPPRTASHSVAGSAQAYHQQRSSSSSGAAKTVTKDT